MSADLNTVNSSNNNTTTDFTVLRCLVCNCRILPVDVAKHNNNNQYHNRIYLHTYNSTAQHNNNSINIQSQYYNPTDYVILTDKYDFDNIGVSKPISSQVNSEALQHSEFSYLVCADCDSGPVGITYHNQPNVYYVVTSRCKKQ